MDRKAYNILVVLHILLVLYNITTEQTKIAAAAPAAWLSLLLLQKRRGPFHDLNWVVSPSKKARILFLSARQQRLPTQMLSFLCRHYMTSRSLSSF
jgi:hypothetical protein